MDTRAGEQAVVNYYNGSFTGGSYVESHIFQKGGGMGSVLNTIGKFALPVLKKLGGYAFKKGINLAADTAGDYLSGRDVGEAFRENAGALAENMKFDAVAQIRGRKRPAKKRSGPPAKKRRRDARRSKLNF